VSWVDGMQIFDISNPLAPQLVSSFDTTGVARGLCISGTFALVADYDFGLTIIDISDPLAPSFTSRLATDGLITAVYARGDYAYLADGMRSLQIADISDPSNPSIIGRCFIPGYCDDVAVNGNYAFAAFAPWGDSCGVAVVDISDPANPQLITVLFTPSEATGLFISGNYGFIANWSAGIVVADISNPIAPVIVDHFNTPGYSRNVLVAGDLVYLVDEYSLIIFRFEPTGIVDDSPVPEDFALNAYPNPFNATVSVSYTLPRSSDGIELCIYTPLGQKVATLYEGKATSGQHEIIWNAQALPSGTYFVRLNADEFARTIKIALLK